MRPPTVPSRGSMISTSSPSSMRLPGVAFLPYRVTYALLSLTMTTSCGFALSKPPLTEIW